jgi:tetratricopeptide (TPR) repeat protein
MVRIVTLILSLTIVLGACGRKPAGPAPLVEPPWLEPIKQMVAKGDYKDSLKALEDQVSRVPPPEGVEQAWYLQGYVQIYGRSDFKKGRAPLQALIDSNPRHPLAAKALRLLGDGYYFDSLYEPARRQYRALMEMYGQSGEGAYALLQTGNCFFQEEKSGEALTAWREAVEKHPSDPFAARAQIAIANMYVTLDDPQMAKAKIQCLLELTKEPGIVATAQDRLKRMDRKKRTSASQEVGA